MNTKSLLLGSAATLIYLISVSGARAADVVAGPETR